jgi:hypothetical protein
MRNITINNKFKVVNNFIFKINLLNLLNSSFFIFFIFLILSTQIYITQGYSLHSFKSLRGVGVEIVERDNIL